MRIWYHLSMSGQPRENSPKALPTRHSLPFFRSNLWLFLFSDRIARPTLALAAGAAILLAVRPGLVHSIVVMRGVTAFFLVLAVTALSIRLQDLESRPERRFWHALAITFGFWIATDLILLIYSGGPLPMLAKVGVELTVAFYYIGLVYSAQIGGHRQGGSRSIDRLGMLAIILFIVGLLIYFDLVPAGSPLAGSEPSTEWLFAVIDLLVTSRLLAFAATSPSLRWRMLYRCLAAATFCSLIGDILGLVLTRAESNVFYSLTMILVIFAARLRHHAFSPASKTAPDRPVTVLSSEAVDSSEAGWQTILYALIFPVIHLLLYQLGLLEETFQPQRESIVLVWIVLLGSIAVNQSQRLTARRKRLETEREDIVYQLRAQSAELERFAFTVSHDLKSPLVTIEGFLGFLLEDMKGGKIERAEKDIEKIRGASQHMGRFLDDLLALSRSGQLVGELEEVPLDTVAREAVEVVRGQLAKHGVEVDIGPGLPVVLGDRTRLLQVLQNLLDNAVKFMGPQPRPQIEISTRQDGTQTVCLVRDNGIGIDPRYHDQVFDLFTRLDHTAKGSGIGLALTQRIIEALGGRIWIESEGLTHGSTFCFFLPPAKQ